MENLLNHKCEVKRAFRVPQAHDNSSIWVLILLSWPECLVSHQSMYSTGLLLFVEVISELITTQVCSYLQPMILRWNLCPYRMWECRILSYKEWNVTRVLYGIMLRQPTLMNHSLCHDKSEGGKCSDCHGNKLKIPGLAYQAKYAWKKRHTWEFVRDLNIDKHSMNNPKPCMADTI